MSIPYLYFVNKDSISYFVNRDDALLKEIDMLEARLQKLNKERVELGFEYCNFIRGLGPASILDWVVAVKNYGYKTRIGGIWVENYVKFPIK